MLRLIAGCPHRASLRYFAIEGALVGRARFCSSGNPAHDPLEWASVVAAPPQPGEGDRND